MTVNGIYTSAWIGRTVHLGYIYEKIVGALPDASVLIVPASKYADLPADFCHVNMSSLFDDPDVRAAYEE